MRIIAAILILLAGIAPAMAQGPRSSQVPHAGAPSPLTGDPIKDIRTAIHGAESSAESLWQKIVNAKLADLEYAKALADNTATAGGKMRSACYGALIAANQQANGVGLKDAAGNPLARPDPSMITGFEQIAEVADNLQPTSPLIVACAPVANAIKQSVMQLITMMVTGAATLSALGVP
jgi:hypothetical protein